ncbi:MAG: hypothetical protein ACRDP2_04965, partial [Nocardioidaceae bacterium]
MSHLTMSRRRLAVAAVPAAALIAAGLAASDATGVSSDPGGGLVSTRDTGPEPWINYVEPRIQD